MRLHWEALLLQGLCRDPRRGVASTFPMDPHTFSKGNWTLQAYINSLQSPSQKVCGPIGNESNDLMDVG